MARKTPTRPADLAKELKVDAKVLRSALRKDFPRKADDRNTSWNLTPAQVKAMRARFAPAKKATPATPKAKKAPKATPTPVAPTPEA